MYVVEPDLHQNLIGLSNYSNPQNWLEEMPDRS
jgi:hypothetical protein